MRKTGKRRESRGEGSGVRTAALRAASRTRAGAMAAAALTALACFPLTNAPAQAAPAARTAQASPSSQPVWRTDVTGVGTVRLPLMTLVPGGEARSVRLSGLERAQRFDFGVRMDEVVSQASLELAFTASAAVLPTVSQLNAYLNGELQGSVTLSEDMIGSPATLRLPLNPGAVRSANQLSLEFVGHVRSVCENPADDSLWLDVGHASRLVLEKSRVRVGNDLTLLPAPFVDANSSAPTRLSFVFPGAPAADLKQSAAMLASWAGRLSGWRGAEFAVSFGARPAPGHFVAFVTNSSRPEFLAWLPEAAGPEVRLADAPGTLADKMLVFSGRDAKDIDAAVRAFIREGAVMIGDTYRPGPVAETPARAAYDAPAWLPLDKTVTLGSLMEYPGQLSARGWRMPPVTLPVRLAPDLFMTESARMTLAVSWRATKPMTGEAAQFRAFLNGALLDSDAVNAKEGAGARRIQLPGFYGAISENPGGALALRPLSRLSFSVDYERIADGGTPENCKSVMLLAHQMEIDPASTLRLEGLWHQARLPDVRLFTTSGFPFTKHADLSQTAVLIADGASEAEVSTMLVSVARMAAQTGAVADKLRVIASPSEQEAARRDILAVGRLPVRMGDISAQAAAELTQRIARGLAKPSDGQAPLAGPQAGVLAEPVAVIAGLESPLARGRSVVALLSEGPGSSALLNANLANPASLGEGSGVSGGVAVLSAGATASFPAAERYVVGNLPWYHRVWMMLAGRPLLLVAAALASALALGLAGFLFMRRWVGGRAK